MTQEASQNNGGMLNASQPIADADGRLTLAGRRFLDMLYKRTGGAEDLIFELYTRDQDNVAFQQQVEDNSERLTDLEGQVAAQTLEQRVQDLEAEVNDLRAESEEFSVGNIRPNGTLSELDKVGQDNAVSDFNGIVVQRSIASADWVKSSVSAPASKALTDYETQGMTTAQFVVKPGDRLIIDFSYRNRSVKDSFEWFTFKEGIEIWADTSTLITTLNDNVYTFGAATNTGVPGGFSSTEEYNTRYSETVQVDVPDPLTGSWPADGILRVILRLTPDDAASGGGSDCISGSTFDGTKTKNEFKVENQRLTVRIQPKKITELIG